MRIGIEQMIPLLLLLVLLAGSGVAKEEVSEQYYEDQFVDHEINTKKSSKRWRQRYYESLKYFGGPGKPIFLILGGEGEVNGLYYPFIHETLAKKFHAAVLLPEHRFYGKSQPIGDVTHGDKYGAMVRLLTPLQALSDAARLVRYKQKQWKCSPLPSSESYCPVISVGGSYPGFLSALIRIVHPDVVDMAYAASAPMKFYAQQVPSNAYYHHITQVAEQSSPGCSAAVRHTLDQLVDDILNIDNTKNNKSNWVEFVAQRLGLCLPLPQYLMQASKQLFLDELLMVIAYTFANANMAYYPPTTNTHLYEACHVFQNTNNDPFQIVEHFLLNIVAQSSYPSCFNMTTQLPLGPNATISGGDWSGIGNGLSGLMWDFQTCTLLVEAIGFSLSMFPNRPWTMNWLKQHCQSRFQVVPQPKQLIEQRNFTNFDNVSNILFTNGCNDGWSVSGIKHNLSDTILALNIQSGAHHSDLSAIGPSDEDTEEMKQAFVMIETIFRDWIQQTKEAQKAQTK